MKQKLKVAKETIKLRMEWNPKDKFTSTDGSKMFGVSYKKFWRWQEEKEKLLPSKKTCPHCGVSEYSRVSKWINDGTLDHLLREVTK